VGQLSKDNIKILADDRTNALIIMASKGDLVTLLEIIKDMDMMLSQVLIEAVIIDVTLGDSLDTGVSWIQKSLTTYEKNAAGLRSPVVAFAGGFRGDSRIAGLPRDASGIDESELAPSGGLGYFFTMFDLNINAVIKASASDSRVKVVSTPVLLTTDNTDAELSSTDKIYVFEGTTYNNNASGSGNNSERYRQEDVGLKLNVTPHINENHIVMMEIEQEISAPGEHGGSTDNLAGQIISSARKITAEIAVSSGQTIILGGQVRESSSRSRTKIPFLGDIPLIGRLFNSDSKSKSRTETIVFITPYVLDSPEEVATETRRRRDSLNIDGMWKQDWSGSKMAEPIKKKRPRGARPIRRNMDDPKQAKPLRPMAEP
jgi:general secretion pathway protein D